MQFREGLDGKETNRNDILLGKIGVNFEFVNRDEIDGNEIILEV